MEQKAVIDNRHTVRNTGIDLLRIVSMFFVVLLHVLGVGGLLEATKTCLIKYETLKVFHIAAMCAVNCYGLISGYVGYRSEFRLSSILTLWLQVFLYSAGFGLLFYLFVPGSVSLKDLVKLCMPVLFQRYWYFTAYFALFFTMPFLNAAIDRIPRRQFELSFGILLFLLTVCQQTIIVNNPFGTNSGYSFLWLCVLYCIGGYLGKYQWRTNKKQYLLMIYMGCVLVCWLAQFVMNKLGIGAPNRLEGYNSPIVLLMSVVLVLLFANLRIPGWMGEIITFLTPASFGVYLIHLHPQVRGMLLMDAFVNMAHFPGWGQVPMVLLVTSGIYVVCTGIDLLRHYLFKAVKLKQRLSQIEKKLLPNDGGNA